MESERKITKLYGNYLSNGSCISGADGTVSKPEKWRSICEAHSIEFPKIACCTPGTFNVLITEPHNYEPPGEEKYRSIARENMGRSGGHHISPVAKIVSINGKSVECWIYRGGHVGEHILELLAVSRLAVVLGINPNDDLILELEEFPECSPEMPILTGMLDKNTDDSGD